MSYLSLGLLAALGCVFAASAWSKLRSRAAQQAFAESLRPVPLVPAGHVTGVAMAATVAEAGLVAGLAAAAVAVTGGWPPARPLTMTVLALTGALLAVFTTGVALAVRRGTGARCACFGAAERPLSARHLVRNGLLLAATGTAALGIAMTRTQPLDLAGTAVALTTGAVCGLLVIRLDDLVDLFTPPPARRPAARPGQDRRA
ncbi:MauE/DoxX family redox-associated membrane protein [Dactylosporangium sp. NPDC006015]|uniref:MauE/DoxX family redox-associated membrane protein n=1 Tax=Dactylosporangium sp. NPDC006015 TaxID=3154576 RepID=UPI0033A277F1